MYAGIFIIIFGICVLLFGFYIYRGHDVSSLLWRAQYKNLNKKQWKNIGKWTMISSLIIMTVGALLWILNLD